MIVDKGAVDWYEYLSKFGIVEEGRKNRKRSQQKHRILNVYAAFDIETSTIWLNPNKRLYEFIVSCIHGSFKLKITQ